MANNMGEPFIEGQNAGLLSTDAKVGVRVANLMNALDDIDNSWIAKGRLLDLCHNFRRMIQKELEQAGWRVALKDRETVKGRVQSWQVLPPNEKSLKAAREKIDA